ncbi:hypothetical protein C8Q77DRAFT_1070895 [Trametes polyzona]|nr:hypothetical protein C8Q77DRAFT_1070895 [Trametes polyzona]
MSSGRNAYPPINYNQKYKFFAPGVGGTGVWLTGYLETVITSAGVARASIRFGNGDRRWWEYRRCFPSDDPVTYECPPEVLDMPVLSALSSTAYPLRMPPEDTYPIPHAAPIGLAPPNMGNPPLPHLPPGGGMGRGWPVNGRGVHGGAGAPIAMGQGRGGPNGGMQGGGMPFAGALMPGQGMPLHGAPTPGAPMQAAFNAPGAPPGAHHPGAANMGGNAFGGFAAIGMPGMYPGVAPGDVDTAGHGNGAPQGDAARNGSNATASASSASRSTRRT